MAGIESYAYLGDNVECIQRSDASGTYRVVGAAGQGMLAINEIMPGVILTYSDFAHVDSVLSDFQINNGSRMLVLDYCLEGRIEWSLAEDNALCLGAGDLGVDNRSVHQHPYTFPLGYYRGISLGFEIEEARESLDRLSPKGFPVDLGELRDAFCGSGSPFVFRSEPAFSHIFGEMHNAPERYRETYLGLKTIEALLALGQRMPESPARERNYLRMSQVDKVHAIRDLIVSDPSARITLEELSRRFEFPYASMQKCFREVYGTSIHAYVKRYRMSQAAVLLRESDLPIAEIAQRMGYANPSKFSAAFREATGHLPTTYRAG